MGELYTSKMLHTNRSTAILATWPSVITILTTRNPNREKLHVEVVKFFSYTHTTYSNGCCFSCWLKYYFGTLWTFTCSCKCSLVSKPSKEVMNGIVMADPVLDSLATFISVSRIISRCAVVDCTIKLDYGEDHVIIAVPLRKPLWYCVCLWRTCTCDTCYNTCL